MKQTSFPGVVNFVAIMCLCAVYTFIINAMEELIFVPSDLL